MRAFTCDVTRSMIVTPGIAVAAHPQHGTVIELGECLGEGEPQFVLTSTTNPPVIVGGKIFDAHPYRCTSKGKLDGKVQKLGTPINHEIEDTRALVLLTHFDDRIVAEDGGEINIVHEGTYMLVVMSFKRQLIVTAPDGSGDRFRLAYDDPQRGPECELMGMHEPVGSRSYAL